MKMYGSFLVFGGDAEPAVILLNEAQMQALRDGMYIAGKIGKPECRHEVYRSIFRMPVQYAVPCWSDEAMTAIATHYKGPHEERIRGLAACIVTGTPYGGPEPGERHDGGGGQKAAIDPVKPKPRKPSGGNAVRPSRGRKVESTSLFSGV